MNFEFEYKGTKYTIHLYQKRTGYWNVDLEYNGNHSYCAVGLLKGRSDIAPIWGEVYNILKAKELPIEWEYPYLEV